VTYSQLEAQNPPNCADFCGIGAVNLRHAAETCYTGARDFSSHYQDLTMAYEGLRAMI
jgi:hypothetical protein